MLRACASAMRLLDRLAHDPLRLGDLLCITPGSGGACRRVSCPLVSRNACVCNRVRTRSFASMWRCLCLLMCARTTCVCVRPCVRAHHVSVFWVRAELTGCVVRHITCAGAVLGQGKFAKVYKATHKATGQAYAIKVFSFPARSSSFASFGICLSLHEPMTLSHIVCATSGDSKGRVSESGRAGQDAGRD